MRRRAPAGPPFLFALFLLASLLTGAGSARAAEAARLGSDVVPTFERVSLTLDPAKPDYRGSVRISLQVNEPARTFRFHAEEMNLHGMVLRGARGPVGTKWEVGARGLVTVTADAPLPRGAYTLAIDFSNHFGTQAAGLYRLETNGEAYAFTQFEADDARKAFPCWDEPLFKIPFQLVLRVPARDLAVTNTPPERTVREKGWKTVTFRRTRPVPSYALAIAAGPLMTVPISGLSVPGRIVFPRGDARLTALAARMAPPILDALTRYFGRPYPYEKLDLIAVPEFWPGGMENAGAITFRDDALLLDPETASAASRSTLARYLAHEIAHQWFGVLVTMKWWDDLWLNESFAEWMGDKIADQLFPELRVGVGIQLEREAAFATDAMLSTHAIRKPVTVLDNLLQSADELSYFKGQAVLAMFERWLGPETFRRGVTDYLAAHEWGSAEGSDLWNALSSASGKDVAGALGTFLDQGGVPLVTAKLLPGGQVELSQKRFLDYGLTAPDQLWRIPVTLKYSVGGSVRTQSVLLDRPAMTVALEGGGTPEWIHPNADEEGYYRWDVGDGMLRRLAENAPALNPRERIGVIENAGGLLHSGALHAQAYMEVLGTFAANEDPQVVDAAVAEVGAVRKVFVTTADEALFAAYVRRTLAAPLRRFGLARKAGEDEAVSLLRPNLLQCLGQDGADPEVLAYADSLAARFMADSSSVDGSLAGVALRLCALHGNAARFDAYRERFERAGTPENRSRFLEALGWFRDPALVERALAYVLTGPLRPQELFVIPGSIGTSPRYEGRPWEWLQANYTSFVARIPAMYSVYMPYLASGCSTERLEQA
jgi:alanyl aminopeptidase